MRYDILAIVIATFIGGGDDSSKNALQESKSSSEYVIFIKKPTDDPRPIRGTIRKPSMEALPGATVELYNASNMLVGSTSSDFTGWYEFLPVPPGTYEIHVSATHYRDTVVNVTVTTLPVLQNITMTDE